MLAVKPASSAQVNGLDQTSCGMTASINTRAAVSRFLNAAILFALPQHGAKDLRSRTLNIVWTLRAEAWSQAKFEVEQKSERSRAEIIFIFFPKLSKRVFLLFDSVRGSSMTNPIKT